MKQDLNAIYSIWLREMLRFFRLKSRLVGSIGIALLLPGISWDWIWVNSSSTARNSLRQLAMSAS